MTTLNGPVLVTGASGFIGRRVVQRLLQEGVTTRALILPNETPPPEWDERLTLIRGDVRHIEVVDHASDGAVVVIHLAAIVTDWADAGLYEDVTIRGTEHVLVEAARDKARVVLASSIAVYGDKLGRQVCSEGTPFGEPQGLYGKAKQTQERIARRLAEDGGLQVTILRPGNVYGPGSRPWVHDVAAQLRAGNPVLFGKGDQDAGLAYVDNVADAFVRAALDPAAVGRTYNVIDGEGVTWGQYMSDIAVALGIDRVKAIPKPLGVMVAAVSERTAGRFDGEKRPILTREALNLVGSMHRIPNDRLREELGWSAGVPYAEGMAATQAYIREKGL